MRIVITRSASGAEKMIPFTSWMERWLMMMCLLGLLCGLILNSCSNLHLYWEQWNSLFLSTLPLDWVNIYLRVCFILERSIVMIHQEHFNDILDVGDDLIYTRWDAVEVQIDASSWAASSSASSVSSSIISVSCTKRLISHPLLPSSSLLRC